MDRKDKLERGRVSRRGFFKLGAAGAALAGVAGACSGGGAPGEAIIPRKRLGKTAMEVSIIGFGGGSALSMIEKDDQAVALIDLARRKGINYFDSGAEYDNGRSQKRFGMALEGHRQEVYLSTKYLPDAGYDKLMKDFEGTLASFRTDYVDVANMHGLMSQQDVEAMFSSGALETLSKLKEQKLVRHIGVTSHGNPVALAEALRRFQFDVSLHAANASNVPFAFEFERYDGSQGFQDLSIPLANEQGIGVWAFKITGQRRLISQQPDDGKAPGEELLRYGLSLPVHGIILGMHTVEHVESAARLAANFTPMTAEEMRQWNERLAPHASELTLHYLRRGYVDDGGWRAHLA